MTYAQYKTHASQRGIALVTAIVAALVISLSAAVILNMTFRRFELSSQRRDRGISLAGIEGATRYIFQRCDLDAVFEARVRQAIIDYRDGVGVAAGHNSGCYVLSPLATDGNRTMNDVIIRYNGVDTGFDIDEQIAEFDYNRDDGAGTVLFRKQVHVAIDFEPNPGGVLDADRRFRLHASTTFGEGT